MSPLKADRHAFEPDPDGRTVADAAGNAFPACRICGKDRRAHPRRTRAEMAALRAAELPTPILLEDEPEPLPEPAHIPAAEPGGAVIVAVVGRLVWSPEIRAAYVAAGELLERSDLPTGISFRAEQLRRAILQWSAENAPEPVEIGTPAPTLDYTPTRIEAARPSREMLELDGQRRRIRAGIRSDRMRLIFDRAVESGWRVDRLGSGHIRLSNPDGEHSVTISATVSAGDAHSYRNARAEAKRQGLDVSGL